MKDKATYMIPHPNGDLCRKAFPPIEMIGIPVTEYKRLLKDQGALEELRKTTDFVGPYSNPSSTGKPGDWP